MKLFRSDSGDSKELLPGVCLQYLVHGERTQMVRFILTQGAEIPAHTHPHEQTGMLISGRLRLTINQEVFEVEKGDSWCIPGGASHYVDVIKDSEVVEVFSPVREDYLLQK